MEEPIKRKTWSEFQSTGLIWYINSILHLFGWAIVYVLDDDKNIIDVYPARSGYRGFSSDINDDGFKKVTKYLKDNIDDLEKETLE